MEKGTSENDSDDQRLEPLETRHVFLDTQVYESLGLDPNHRLMAVLRAQIDAQRIVLHTTDITLWEVHRHIEEAVAKAALDYEKMERNFARWRGVGKEFLPRDGAAVDAAALAAALFADFRSFILVQCKAELHEALAVDPKSVFRAYFSRKAPFDTDKKEFPDGFVLEALRRWCKKNHHRMYIVAADGAVSRAATNDQAFHHLKTLAETLKRAGKEIGPSGQTAAKAVLELPRFLRDLKSVLREQINQASFTYLGDRPDGEIHEGKYVSFGEIYDWSVVGLTSDYITLILSVFVTVKFEVDYEDLDEARYDSEDRVWVGGRSAVASVTEEISVEIVVEVRRKTGRIREGKLLTEEIEVYEPTDEF